MDPFTHILCLPLTFSCQTTFIFGSSEVQSSEVQQIAENVSSSEFTFTIIVSSSEFTLTIIVYTSRHCHK